MLRTESRAQLETIRAAVENLQAAANEHKSLMKASTQRIDTVVKFGVVLSEVCALFSGSFDDLSSTDESVREGSV
jgi:hypothetical protein